jgi:hypothetical protein
MRDSLVFYRSFYEAIKDLPRDIQGDVYTAIMEYGLNGITTENLKPIARGIFTLIKPSIDANNKRFENGRKGGRPSKEESELKPNHNQTTTKHEPNEDEDEDVNADNNPHTFPDGKVSPPAWGEPRAKIDFPKRKEKFKNELAPYLETYGREMLNEFFAYWTEPNKPGTKMNFELERTWDLSRRLATWDRRASEYSKNSKTARPGRIMTYDQMCEEVRRGAKQEDFILVAKGEWRRK